MDKLNKVVIPEGFKATKIQVVDGFLTYELEPIEKSIKEQVKDWFYKNDTVKYWISSTGKLDNLLYSIGEGKHILPTPAHCEQILALEQLILACWVVNGCKEAERTNFSCVIHVKSNNDFIISTDRDFIIRENTRLRFINKKTAEKFMAEYSDLLETAKPLL